MYRFYDKYLILTQTQNYTSRLILVVILSIALVCCLFQDDVHGKDVSDQVTESPAVNKRIIIQLQDKVKINSSNNSNSGNSKNDAIVDKIATIVRLECYDLPFIIDDHSNPWLFLAFQKNIEKKLLTCDVPAKTASAMLGIARSLSPEGKVMLLHRSLLTDDASSTAFSRINDKTINDEGKKSKISQLKEQWLIANIPIEKEKELGEAYRLNENEMQQRISYLLWHEKIESTKFWLKKLPANAQVFWEKELKIAMQGKSIDNGKNDKGQSDFEKYIKLRSMRKLGSPLLVQSLASYKPKSNQEIWWKNIGQFAVREAIRTKKYKSAYNIAQNYMPNPKSASSPSGDVAEAYWLSGFISFHFLHNYKSAYQHFIAMYKIAKLANSKSQAAYWAAMAAKAMKNNKDYLSWLQTARGYKGYFYGYAAEILDDKKKNLTYDSFLASAKKNDQTEQANAEKKKGQTQGSQVELREMLFAANLLFQSGYTVQADTLTDYYISQQNPSNIDEVLRYFYSQGHAHLSVKLSRKVANQHGCIHYLGYPNLKIETKYKKSKSLYLAVMRQESSFDPKAVSSAGAFGLMQLMPDTAKRMAKKIGEQENSYRTSPKANIAKGICYIDWLSEQFPSLVLVIAAYNAGEGNAKKWQKQYNFSDKSMHDIVTFIELMPFNETRFYVKKVLENFWTYELIFYQKKNKSDLIADLAL